VPAMDAIGHTSLSPAAEGRVLGNGTYLSEGRTLSLSTEVYALSSKFFMRNSAGVYLADQETAEKMGRNFFPHSAARSLERGRWVRGD